jgi:O-antigen ligase
MEPQKSVHTERLGPSFICFLIWTFVIIARPQDYLTFLMALRPVLVICIITMVVMLLERVELPEGMFRLSEVRLALLFYLIMLAGMPFAVHRGVAFRFLTTVLPATLAYFLVSVIQLRSLRKLNITAMMIAVSILFSGSLYVVDAARYQGFRAAASGMYDPNDVAMLFTAFIPLCLYVLLAGFGWKAKLLSAVAACAGAVGVMLSRSRGGVLALAVIIVVFFLSSAPRIKGVAKVATVILLAVIFLSYFSAVEGRFENMGRDYNLNDENGRINIWKQNLIIIAENPFLGAGAGCATVALGLFRGRVGGTQAWLTSHSSLVQVAVETGIPGFIVFLILNIVAIVNLRRIRRDRGDPLSRLAFFVELSFYGFWAGALLLSHAYSVSLYLLLGFSAALRYLHRHSATSAA